MLRDVIHLMQHGGTGYVPIDKIWVTPDRRLHAPGTFETDQTAIPASKRVEIKYVRGDRPRFVVRLPDRKRVLVRNFSGRVRVFYQTPDGAIEDLLPRRLVKR